MFRTSKIMVQNPAVSHEQATDPAKLKVKLSPFMKLIRVGRMGNGRKFVYGTDEEILAPIKTVVEITKENIEPARLKPQPPPLPYRLTFKSKKASKNPWSRHRTVIYDLGFNSSTVNVKVVAFESGLRRVFVNSEELIRVQSNENTWSFSHFYSENHDENTSSGSLGVILKVVVQKNLKIHLYADGFPVEKLRRSSVYMKGSPPPPGPCREVETLDRTEVSRIVHLT